MRLLWSLLICLKISRMHYITGQREYNFILLDFCFRFIWVIWPHSDSVIVAHLRNLFSQIAWVAGPARPRPSAVSSALTEALRRPMPTTCRPWRSPSLGAAQPTRALLYMASVQRGALFHAFRSRKGSNRRLIWLRSLFEQSESDPSSHRFGSGGSAGAGGET
jgi:hypothetical protein